MRSDPLVVAITLAIRAEREEIYAALANTRFPDLYDVGLLQGRLQGLDLAQKAINETDKELNEG